MKICPLGAAEYRQDAGICATCGAQLVDSLASAELDASPPVLLWTGKDATEFDLVSGHLGESQIPAHAEEGLGGMVSTLLKSVSKIHVLHSDLDRALSVAVEAIARRTSGIGETESCYSCGAQCSAALAHCPRCRAVLIVEQSKRRGEGTREPTIEISARKLCPVCEAEYRPDFEHCSVCGVQLTPQESRGRPLTGQQRREPLEIAWRSADPVAVCEAIRIVRGERILHHVRWSHDHLVFGLAIPRPRYEIRVFASQAEQVRQLCAGIQESLPFAIVTFPPDMSRAVETSPAASKHLWNPAAATIEIWSDDDSAVAQLLIDCLLEHRIGVRLAGRAPGRLTLLVMAQDEIAAREIIREVEEGTPLA